MSKRKRYEPTKKQGTAARKQWDEFEATIAALPIPVEIRDEQTVGIDENGDELILWPIDHLGEPLLTRMTRRLAVRTEYIAEWRRKNEPQPLPRCKFCNIEFDDEYDADSMCTTAMDANSCHYHPSRRPKQKLQAVGADFERLEDNPMRLEALQSLINDGAAWHPDIDQDGHIGRQADDLIARKILKAPRTYEAKKQRHLFDVARRFGLDRKKRA